MSKSKYTDEDAVEDQKISVSLKIDDYSPEIRYRSEMEGQFQQNCLFGMPIRNILRCCTEISERCTF